MTAAATVAPAGPGPLKLVGREIRYQQIMFWRNPYAAFFTLGFSVIFLVMLSLAGGTSRTSVYGGIKTIQYFVPGFLAYGVMAACFNTLAISLVVRREMGLLKRLRLSPLPSWALIGAIAGNCVIVSAIQVALLLLVGSVGFGVVLPHNWVALILALLTGVACFTALGVAVSTILPNQEAAGPVISIVFFLLLFLSGLWFPLQAGSELAQISGYFPVRHFITATFAPFDLRPGVSAWSWNDILVMAIWGAVATFVGIRRFKWGRWKDEHAADSRGMRSLFRAGRS